jgi:hypothetical protein
VTPPRRPITTRGTTSTDRPGPSAKERLVNATGPVPGNRSSSSTTIRAEYDRHHESSRVNRSGPLASTLASWPQPTSPSPPFTQHSAPAAAGSRSGSALTSSTTLLRARNRSAVGAVVTHRG